jgi:hypothetical protein
MGDWFYETGDFSLFAFLTIIFQYVRVWCCQLIKASFKFETSLRCWIHIDDHLSARLPCDGNRSRPSLLM